MKPTREEHAARIAKVVDMILDGAEHWDIVQCARELSWDVCDSTIWNYQRRALDHIAKYRERDRDLLIGRHLAQRRRLYARCIQIGDIATALRTVADEARLIGLYPEQVRDLSDAERLRAVMELLERGRARADGQTAPEAPPAELAEDSGADGPDNPPP